MSQPGEILIGNLGADYVLIRIKSDNDGWRGGDIEIQCDGWAGRTNADFQKGELRQFGAQLKQLRHTLSGRVELIPIEPNLKMSLSGDGKGHIRVEGVGRNHFERATRLEFCFDIDQTFVEKIANALMEADPID
jgi:hypothetical protein